MSLSSFSPLSLLTPMLLLVLGVSLMALWRRWHDRQELGWMGLALGSSAVGMLVQVLPWADRAEPVPPHDVLTYVLSFSVCYLVGVIACAHSLALRLGVAMPWRQAIPLAAVLLLGQGWFVLVQPDLTMRVYWFTAGVMLLLALPLQHWRGMTAQNHFDKLLRAVYVLCIVLNLLRTFWLLPQTQGVMTEAFTYTWFWVVVHFSAVLTALTLAGSMALAVTSDVIHGLQQERNLDPLTRLLNRRAFHEQVRRLERLPQSTWMMLACDLDHFKWVNDTWGHAAGDGVLQVIADLLQRNVRGSDVVARFGGEEFVVLLAESDMPTAMQVAERIRKEVAELRLPMLVGERITVSIGVTALQSLAATDVQAALARADQQLFTAKRAGRNRVRGPAPAPPPVSPALAPTVQTGAIQAPPYLHQTVGLAAKGSGAEIGRVR